MSSYVSSQRRLLIGLHPEGLISVPMKSSEAREGMGGGLGLVLCQRCSLEELEGRSCKLCDNIVTPLCNGGVPEGVTV